MTQNEEVTTVNQSEVGSNVQEQQEKQPKVYFDEIDKYRVITNSFKEEMEVLIKSGDVTEAVAERLLNDFTYNAFSQIVKVNYR